MGMFDYVEVAPDLLPLVDGKKVRHDGFQTKDGPCILTTFVVGPQSISYMRFRYQWDETLESPAFKAGLTEHMGALKHVDENIVLLGKDQSLHFYDSNNDFFAYFKDGNVVIDHIKP